ncbi:alpha/beta hydrolase family protein [Nocardia arizonensis]|uniref:alpha/beta hydrolase family protein n=1 Tax=Nocardia arizonensis TaxID=1141647 RepID=UPI0019515E81|nr:alpha/beta fold hydrolase [Nocardia arizonensis]
MVSVPDGADLALRVLPHPDPAAPIVLILPGMAIEARFYLPLVAALHAAGFAVALVDLRAQGESGPEPESMPDFGYRELVEVDLPAVVDTLGDRFPGAPLHLFGHSLGGQLALLYAAGERGRVASVVTIGTGSVYWRSFPPGRKLRILFSTQWVGVVCRLRGRWPGGGGIGPMTAGVMADWVRHARTGRYRPRGSSRDYDRLLGDLMLPVLVISIDGDPLGPEKTVRFLCGRIPSANVTRWHLDASSGVQNLGHASWVKDSDVIGPAVAAWITTGTTPGRNIGSDV